MTKFLWLVGIVFVLALTGTAVTAVFPKSSVSPAPQAPSPQTAEETVSDSEDDIKQAERLQADLEASINDSSDQDLSDLYDESAGL